MRPWVVGYSVNMLGAGTDPYDGVIVVDAGDHPLQFLVGAHPVIARVSHGVSSHVSALDVCVNDNGAAFEFVVRRPLASRRARPVLRGHVVLPSGDRITLGARARDERERSFDLLVARADGLETVGSIRLGQRVVIEGERTQRRERWALLTPQAAA